MPFSYFTPVFIQKALWRSILWNVQVSKFFKVSGTYGSVVESSRTPTQPEKESGASAGAYAGCYFWACTTRVRRASRSAAFWNATDYGLSNNTYGIRQRNL